MSKVISLHHIVFSTKRRGHAIPREHKRDLYAYIMGVLESLKCRLIRINGMADHIHMLIDLHPSISLSDTVREVKRSSSIWLRDNPKFPLFWGWNDGYYAASIGVDGIEAVKQYIINQDDHHVGLEFLSEMEAMARENRLMWHPEDFE